MAKKFQFSLQKLLNFKEQVFETERNILAEMRVVLARLQSERTDMENDHKLRSIELKRVLAEGVAAIELARHKSFIRLVEESIEQKTRQINLQQQAIDKQADKVREAKIEISTIEKLKEKKYEEYLYKEGKEQEQFVEEFVNTQKAMANHTS